MPTITANRTARTLQASTSNAAGGTTTSSTWTAGTAIGGMLQIRVANGATGPTVGCTVTINIATDGAGWRGFQAIGASTANNAVLDIAVKLPDETISVQVVFSGNTGQAVTVEALLHELTSFTY